MENVNGRLRPSSSLKVTDTQDGVVILDVQHGMCFPLDTVGTLIWKQLDEGRSIDDIGLHIAALFHISPEQACGDVQEFVEQLRQKHLVLPQGQDIEQATEKQRVGVAQSIWRWLASWI